MKKLHAILPVPPPLNGMTLASKALLRSLERDAFIHTFSNQSSLSPRLWSLARHALTTTTLLRAVAISRGRHSAYFVPSAGSGLIFNIGHAVLLRLGFKRVWLHHHVFSYCRTRDKRMAMILNILGSRTQHIVLGEAMAVQLTKNYGNLPCTILNNACLTREIFAAREKEERQTITFGYLGNGSLIKGLDTAIDLMRAIGSQSKGCNFLIAGPAGDSECRAMIERFVSEDPPHREFLGALDENKKAKFFHKVDVLLFPTRYVNEAQPITIFEALANGCPVLATDRGCIREQIGTLGTCFPEQNYVENSVKMAETWLADLKILKKDSVAARSLYRHHLEDSQKQLDTLLDEMTRDNKERAPHEGN